MADISPPLIAHDPSLLVGRVNAARLCDRSPRHGIDSPRLAAHQGRSSSVRPFCFGGRTLRNG